MAPVSVRDMMTLPALQGTYVLAGGGGLDRTVTGVNVMEVPDVEAFVRSGEVLLTTAYPVRDRPERLVEMVPYLSAKGLAALAVKPRRYLDRIPDGLAAEADRLGFPVLVLPGGTSFNEVIGAVLAVVLAEDGAEPRRAEAIRERLTGVTLTGGGLDEIARTLAGALDRRVQVVDEEGEVVGDDAAHRTGPLRLAADLGDLPWRYPVTVAGAHRGQVLVGGTAEPSLGQRRLIRQACFATGMHIAQAMAGLQLDRRLRVTFLEELVTTGTTDQHLLRQRSGLFGWDLSGPLVVVLARTGAEPTDAQVTERAADRFGPHTLAWSRGQEVVVIAPAGAVDPATAETWGRDLDGLVDRPGTAHALPDRLGSGGTVVAVGATAASAADLVAGHATAREALRIAEVTGRTTVRHEDLVTERLLLAVPAEVRAELVRDTVGPLVEHDRQHDGDLCRTLDVYLGVGNGAEAARRLFIHYNTLKHRLARVVELTGADLHDPRTRLALLLALQARSFD